MSRILIVDDDRETCRFVSEVLAGEDREFAFAHDPEQAIALATGQAFDIVISDINLNAARTGLDVLRAFKRANPAGEVVLISGFGTLETAVEAVRAGAFDYISKPFNLEEMKGTIDRALAQARAPRPPQPPVDMPPAGLVGRSPGMLAVYKQIAYAADSPLPVLIRGESGTGKELVARAVHGHGRRTGRPFVAVNCGAITETLLESELFGHTRGAFTGAVADAKGLFEQAHGGTVFLDEIGETPSALQVKLLRVLEDGEVRPVGGSRAVRVEARVIAATNADLERAVAEGAFREDLFYRLNVVVIRLPPLRDRRDDIPLLAARALEAACTRNRRRVTIAPAALQVLTAYRWPGNVRELEHTIESLVLFSRGSTIDVDDLPAHLRRTPPDRSQGLFEDLPTLQHLERRYLLHVLDRVGRNRTRAAEVLGIDRRTLYRMAERHGIDLDEA